MVAFTPLQNHFVTPLNPSVFKVIKMDEPMTCSALSPSVGDFSDPAYFTRSYLPPPDTLPNHELQPTQTTDDLQGRNPNEDRMSGLREFSLPPVNKGKDARLCLVGGFFLELMVWGFPFSFGVFQDYYSTTEQFAQGKSSVFIIGSYSMVCNYPPPVSRARTSRY